nr:response regulator [Motiliproteus sediminis]
MIIDDEPALCAGLSSFLEDEGIGVQIAASGAEALALAEQNNGLQLCILDMRLPDIDGNQLALRLHQLDPSLRFLIHTGSAAYSPPDSLQRLGISERDVFSKPLLDMGLLVDAIKRLLHD